MRQVSDSSAPMIVLATAHPAKFPDAVERATGRLPSVPTRLEKALSGREDYASIDANADSVRAFIRQHSRIQAIGAPS
jgi:threonine synthase